MCCNQSKGKCQWPGDGKDSKAGPKARGKVNKGKKQKADDESPEPRLSQKKWAKSKPLEVLVLNEPEASGSGARVASTGLYNLHKTTVTSSGWITNALEAILDESYGYGMAVTPLYSGLSELNPKELHEEADWLQAEAEGEEDKAKGEDKAMAEAD
ncbi:hypothetical protein M404DRAFT_34522 [Pisolithus tinctorius Marx 270]|uniref:Uncharacterized protein n=1 Tax=Pisolithus tinctorius Marx 270 TaxID=870435 RepID=A0A0C3NH15_PISTI|nr:hypothetical protein M404DRAFT_34522 [Pisolithus tinctorius Marx 270]